MPASVKMVKTRHGAGLESDDGQTDENQADDEAIEDNLLREDDDTHPPSIASGTVQSSSESAEKSNDQGISGTYSSGSESNSAQVMIPMSQMQNIPISNVFAKHVFSVLGCAQSCVKC